MRARVYALLVEAFIVQVAVNLVALLQELQVSDNIEEVLNVVAPVGDNGLRPLVQVVKVAAISMSVNRLVSVSVAKKSNQPSKTREISKSRAISSVDNSRCRNYN